MIDPLLSLAYSVHSNKGIYALLLGSGVSRSASIPTGWEVVLDLVTKLAAMQREDCSNDPAKWFREKYGEEPDYSKLLDAIAKSPEERQQLLVSYFEPTEEERADGLKLPTAGHRAVARLVASGHVRVIVTTNFDRLVERAIEDEGITPVVLSTVDAISGALPIVHQRCCVIKLHGDYLDTRIKNTPAELSTYDPSIEAMLDRVFDEFGLVVCGWSAQWDVCLRGAIERCKSRRFTTYWAVRGDLTPDAQRLLDLRAGVRIPIRDADSFMQELAEKVVALDELNQPHPLSVASAVATTKRLLASDSTLIRFHDLLQQETEKSLAGLQPSFAAILGPGNQGEKFAAALPEFFAASEILRAVAATTAFWGRPCHAKILSQIAPNLATDPFEGQGGTHLRDSVRAIPSVILLYTMGIASLANSNFAMLASILSQGRLNRRGERQHYLTALDWPEIQGYFKVLENRARQYYPASEWLFENCRSSLKSLVSSDLEYERLFDTFEVVRSLVYIDCEHNGQYLPEATDFWGPPGRFVWKLASRGRHEDYLEIVKADTSLAEGLAAAGLFGGSADVFRNVAQGFAPMVARFAKEYF
jgi:hypothetical protein